MGRGFFLWRKRLRAGLNTKRIKAAGECGKKIEDPVLAVSVKGLQALNACNSLHQVLRMQSVGPKPAKPARTLRTRRWRLRHLTGRR